MKTISKLWIVLLLTALALGACAPKAPANKLEAIKSAGKMVVGTSADYAPFEYKDEQDNFVGFDMDLIREIGKRMGVEVEIQDMAFDSLVAAVEQGKVDVVIASMTPTEERLQQVDFSITYHVQKSWFLIPNDSSITLASPQDAAAYKIGVQTGTTLDDWVTKNLVETGKMPAENVFRYERADQSILDLQAGRIDLVLTDAGPAKEYEKNGQAKVVLTEKLFESGENIAIPKGETALKAELDKIIQELIDEGYIDKLAQQYGLE
ncbi:MAG: ABC transporter substrate-binding protein [Anaerolineaceae bacterium]